MPLKKNLSQLPDSPGIYLYYNISHELIYVGKATSLKSRVGSYFKGARTTRPIEQMIHEVVDIKWKETESVLEAVILEANAIQKNQPKYNVLGKDGKSWNYIYISKDPYPFVGTIRERELELLKKENKKARKQENTFVPDRQVKTQKQWQYVFGPYPGLNTRATMKLLRRMFSISTCQSLKKESLPTMPTGRQAGQAGKKARKQESTKSLKQRPCLYYEMGECLGVCTGEITPSEYRAKVIRPLVTLLSGRKKQLIKSLEIKMRKEARAEHFEEAARLRNQVSALQRIQDIALLNKSFVESRTTDYGLQTSAAGGLRLSQDDDSRSPKSEVNRIEGYDISNLGTTGKVGSMVVFEHGEPKKSDYRKFKIRGVLGQSDVDCLEEVLRRRLAHTEWPLPYIFLIDGGSPQVNRVKKIFAEVGITIPIVGIAKGPERKRNDFIFGLRTSDSSLRRDCIRWVHAHQDILIQVRDEAHRFAITYQRKLRNI